MAGPESKLGLSFSGRKAIPVWRQTELAECGLTCVGMVACHYGHKLDLNGLRKLFPSSITGSRLTDLMRISKSLGLSARAVKVDLNSVRSLNLPCILHWNSDHFVVLEKVSQKEVTIIDPSRGRELIGWEAVSDHFAGIALELEPSPEFEPLEAVAPARLSDIWGRLRGWKAAIIQILFLSIVMQVMVIVAPLFLQIVVDTVLLRGEHEILLSLCIAFALAYTLSASTMLMREWVVLYFGNIINYQSVGRLVSHLFHLPVNFFESRHIGDILSRISSTRPLQVALTEGLVIALLDGLLALSVIFILFIIDVRIGLTMLTSIMVLSILTYLFSNELRVREEKQIADVATEQTHLMESIRAITTIRIFGRETEREGTWRNQYADVINSTVSAGKIRILMRFAEALVLNYQLIIIIGFGALGVINSTMTVGMLTAVIAYQQVGAQRFAAFVRQAVAFRMLGLHLSRLGDIVHAESDEISETQSLTHPKGSTVEFRQVSFSYIPNAEPILKGLSFEIDEGEFVAITGTSGVGKTTLVKLMLGLQKPLSGHVIVGGTPIDAADKRLWRQQIGVVMQNDRLLSGTLADNIAFLDPEPDFERIKQAAVTACIDEDIMRMPMGYRSLIGDMGSALSGGQYQRVLLARALYRQPKILILDEGTANLDPKTELSIAATLRSLNHMTRIVVAHRRALVDHAERILVVHKDGVDYIAGSTGKQALNVGGTSS